MQTTLYRRIYLGRWVGEERQEVSQVPEEADYLVPGWYQIISDRGVRGHDRGQREEEDKVDVTSEVGEELDDGDLVHLVVNGETEEEPDWREEDEQEEESEHSCIAPVETAWINVK